MKIKKITGNDVKRISHGAPTWDAIAEELNNLIDSVRLVAVMHITGVGASGEEVKVQDIAVTSRMLEGVREDTWALAKTLGPKYGIETVTQVSVGSPRR